MYAWLNLNGDNGIVFWKFHGINCRFNFQGVNSTIEIAWDILRILVDYRLRHIVNNVAIHIYV